ncbi:hypothetical protein KUTeg_002176 [Tegillarca granosa]|uniref:Transmembrane protein 185B n=1 Tax=Tegillarca granosa TaxID=220873 RepID=A0ABQ9FTK6_TEGGR|nr:hypothetical protein KUTeg_002176 [Tegillarca granosa]
MRTSMSTFRAPIPSAANRCDWFFKFLVFTCLLLFTLLFALRLDDTIKWSYWVIFLPIWIWKIVVIAGASVGRNGYVQYKAMIICTGMHLLLLMFEILACDNLETGSHSWILVFIPLMFISIVSIGICVWAVKNERSFELELFCSVNILQFIFLALRLDKIILWSWVSPDIIPQQRRGNISSAIGYSFMVVPLLVFEVLLANRLDGDNQFMYTAITVPLFISLITLICLSFGWFGIRKDFCIFLLGVCPFLQEYGNISYSIHTSDTDQEEVNAQTRKLDKLGSKHDLFEELPKVVVPIISIETPD